MADSPKTVPTDADVSAFVAAVKSPVRRRDAGTLLGIMERVTGLPAVMWGPSIVGFGEYRYRYATGRESVMAAAGFSPRASSSTVYLADGFEDRADLLARLGPHTTGASCLYLKDLTKVDLAVLEELVAASYASVTAPGFGS